MTDPIEPEETDFALDRWANDLRDEENRLAQEDQS